MIDMRAKTTIFLILISIVILSGKNFAQSTIEPQILRQVSSEKKRNSNLESAIVSKAGITEDDVKQDARYFYNYVDLNGDGTFEVLVYVFGGYFCGTGGCDAFLFKKSHSTFKLINSFGPVRNPIIVSENKTNGWNDLIFFNRGGGINPGYYSVCKFNGKIYPENPTNGETAPPLKKRVKGIEYLIGNGYGKSGLDFRLNK